ncbi:hypothetical protein AAG570_003873 [Ranatra chinensis]|uniref:G-protein coupled receptors family 1 profile domain-containing protein n=1 Tax=Ranatra chinensis TaxID=642074 RepID=A0ABD0YER4_9HEMI
MYSCWVCGLLLQSVVFHVLQHPQYPDFWQCVSFGFFRSQAQETAYNLFCVFAMYFLPLFVICFAYSCILWEISKKTRETRGEEFDFAHEANVLPFIGRLTRKNIFKPNLQSMFHNMCLFLNIIADISVTILQSGH